ATAADREVLEDSSYYRVFEPAVGLNGARTSYFHHSIGGYHAAKPGRLQELFEYQMAKNNRVVLDMLNVKYILQKDQEGKQGAVLNGEAAGNAWFVRQLQPVEHADGEMGALDTLDIRHTAV